MPTTPAQNLTRDQVCKEHRIGRAADRARDLFVACTIGLRVYRQHLKRLEIIQNEGECSQ